ncbi:MAG TPA: pyridoxal-phosphate dependent enzyme [Burkholderiaceae bacterium]|nr:pyridoxal-phosphate dependent enzyme [Burkholderiaceae bacterium]
MHPIGPVGLTLEQVHEAHQRIKDKITRTPVMTSHTLDSDVGAQLFFKCENFQKIGAFKARGATNAVFCLSEAQARKGVATHSSGNHGAALARAARLRAIPACVVMPNNASRVKRESVERYGGNVVLCEPTLEARENTLERVIADTGASVVHPYNDLRVMAGQGTTAVELIESVADLDVIFCPVGGGGLLSGVAVAAKNISPSIRIIGVEPAAADDAARSFKTGRIVPSVNPRTIADGLRTSLGDKPFAEIQRYVDDIVTVSEEAIVGAMRRIWEVMKILVEPSSAVAYAAVVEAKVDVGRKKVGLILTGGNVDLDTLPWVKA